MSYPVPPPPITAALSPSPSGRPPAVTFAAALLWLMAGVGLIYAIATLAIVPGTISRFRDVTGNGQAFQRFTGDSDPEYYVAVVWLGAAIALAMAVIAFALFVVVGLSLRRGSNAARVATLVVCVLGIVGGAASVLTVAAQRSGETAPWSLGAQLSDAYPGGWVGTNAGLSVAQMLGYALVGILVLTAPRAFFRRPAAPSAPQPAYGVSYPAASPYGGHPVEQPTAGAAAAGVGGVEGQPTWDPASANQPTWDPAAVGAPTSAGPVASGIPAAGYPGYPPPTGYPAEQVAAGQVPPGYQGAPGYPGGPAGYPVAPGYPAPGYPAPGYQAPGYQGSPGYPPGYPGAGYQAGPGAPYAAPSGYEPGGHGHPATPYAAPGYGPGGYAPVPPGPGHPQAGPGHLQASPYGPQAFPPGSPYGPPAEASPYARPAGHSPDAAFAPPVPDQTAAPAPTTPPDPHSPYARPPQEHPEASGPQASTAPSTDQHPQTDPNSPYARPSESIAAQPAASPTPGEMPSQPEASPQSAAPAPAAPVAGAVSPQAEVPFQSAAVSVSAEAPSPADELAQTVATDPASASWRTPAETTSQPAVEKSTESTSDSVASQPTFAAETDPAAPRTAGDVSKPPTP